MPADSQDPLVWMRELSELNWRQVNSTVWKAPCGCLFRGPWRAWKEATGTHLADHIASGAPLNAR